MDHQPLSIDLMLNLIYLRLLDILIRLSSVMAALGAQGVLRQQLSIIQHLEVVPFAIHDKSLCMILDIISLPRCPKCGVTWGEEGEKTCPPFFPACLQRNYKHTQGVFGTRECLTVLKVTHKPSFFLLHFHICSSVQVCALCGRGGDPVDFFFSFEASHIWLSLYCWVHGIVSYAHTTWMDYSDTV